MTIYWTIVLINTFAAAGSMIAFHEKILCRAWTDDNRER